MELERLDPGEILKTARRLHDRIAERFPNAGLVGVSAQLVELARRARATSAEIARPNLKLRAASYAAIALVVVGSIAGVIAALSTAGAGRITWAELVQVAEAGANDVVLLGAAIYFMVSFETRLRRNRVIHALQQLRTLAHLIDVHQLTKTPDMIGHEAEATLSSPARTMTPFEMGRYLDYCIEMLSLTGKISALYGEGFDDADANDAINDLERMTIQQQGKIWQKIMLLQTVHAPPAPIAEAVDDA